MPVLRASLFAPAILSWTVTGTCCVRPVHRHRLLHPGERTGKCVARLPAPAAVDDDTRVVTLDVSGRAMEVVTFPSLYSGAKSPVARLRLLRVRRRRSRSLSGLPLRPKGPRLSFAAGLRARTPTRAGRDADLAPRGRMTLRGFASSLGIA